MSTDLKIISAGKTLHVQVSGKLSKETYEVFLPAIVAQIKEHVKIRILFEMHDFHGWTMGAMWEDLKFDFAHWKDIERLAIVGESKWEAGMAVFCKPFTAAKIQYFDHAKLDEAKAWIESE